jgi:HAD superfamily hydrolase (TIGR01509 family)
MTEAVIFDLYGTLIRLDRDTSPYLRLARLVRPDDPRDVVQRSLLIDTRGIGDFAGLLGAPAPSGIEDLDADLRRDLQTARVFEDVAETLTGLRGRGLRLGLISNLASPYKEPFYQHGLAAYFDVTLFSCDAGLCKPEPEAFLRTARELGVSPANAVMVGDSRRSDYDGARAVGMEAVLLRRSGEARGDRSIKSLRELTGEIRL